MFNLWLIVTIVSGIGSVFCGFVSGGICRCISETTQELYAYEGSWMEEGFRSLQRQRRKETRDTLIFFALSILFAAGAIVVASLFLH